MNAIDKWALTFCLSGIVSLGFGSICNNMLAVHHAHWLETCVVFFGISMLASIAAAIGCTAYAIWGTDKRESAK